jgi:SNF2 family DNA or RNA helicase
VEQVPAKTKVLITGTPIQNYLLDLWSLMDLVEPGLLGKLEYFEDLTKSSPSEAAALGIQASPFILRRLGVDVQLQMPESFFTVIPIPFTDEDQTIYSDLKAGNHVLTLGKKGMALLPALRIFSAHTGSIENNAARGNKSEYLVTELRKVAEAGEKALIFVDEFDAPVDLYQELVSSVQPGCFVKSIDGRTNQQLRFPIVEAFSNVQGFAALVIKPSVGGEGLNITCANHVFHMNPAWNPAKVEQATFRVLRPGQRRTTFVHQVFYTGSIEESMMNLLQQKKEISISALEQAEAEGDNKTI